MLQQYAQQIIDIATGVDGFRIEGVSHFDTSDVITTEPYGLQIDDSGKLIEMQLFFRVQNEGKKMYGLTMYEMPVETGEQYQNPIRIPGRNLFERTIHGLPEVLRILSQCGYVW